VTLEITKAHCNECGRSTNHDVIAAVNHSSDESYLRYEMLRCRGCESVSLRQTLGYADSEPTVFHYPPAIARRAPGWAGITLWDLGLIGDDPPPVPAHISSLMREVYEALQNGLRRLVAMGIRSALESVMVHKVGDQLAERSGFPQKLDEFQKAGYLSPRQRLQLDTVVAAGNAAVHQEWTPTDEDIATLLDIIESVIATAYLHDQPAAALERRVPPKPSKSAPKPK
jgi:hypothetical protein